MPVLKFHPRSSVRKCVGANRCSKIESCADAFIQIAPNLADRLDTCRLPDPTLHDRGAAGLTSTHKCSSLFGNQRECRNCVLKSVNARWIGAWADDHEIVVHNFAVINAVAICNKAVLAAPVMDEHGIDAAPAPPSQEP